MQDFAYRISKISRRWHPRTTFTARAQNFLPYHFSVASAAYGVVRITDPRDITSNIGKLYTFNGLLSNGNWRKLFYPNWHRLCFLISSAKFKSVSLSCFHLMPNTDAKYWTDTEKIATFQTRQSMQYLKTEVGEIIHFQPITVLLAYGKLSYILLHVFYLNLLINYFALYILYRLYSILCLLHVS